MEPSDEFAEFDTDPAAFDVMLDRAEPAVIGPPSVDAAERTGPRIVVRNAGSSVLSISTSQSGSSGIVRETRSPRLAAAHLPQVRSEHVAS